MVSYAVQLVKDPSARHASLTVLRETSAPPHPVVDGVERSRGASGRNSKARRFVLRDEEVGTTDHTLPAPRELSPASAQIWRDVIHDHEFEAHELPLLVSALRWRDKSTAWLRGSEEATGREQARLVKQSLDAAQTSLRHWRALKFTDPEGKTRRPGRPAGGVEDIHLHAAIPRSARMTARVSFRRPTHTPIDILLRLPLTRLDVSS